MCLANPLWAALQGKDQGKEEKDQGKEKNNPRLFGLLVSVTHLTGN